MIGCLGSTAMGLPPSGTPAQAEADLRMGGWAVMGERAVEILFHDEGVMTARPLPLASIGTQGEGGVLFWWRSGPNTVQTGFELPGEGLVMSEPFSVATGAVTLVLGSSSLTDENTFPGLWVEVNGRTQLVSRLRPKGERLQVFTGVNRGELSRIDAAWPHGAIRVKDASLARGREAIKSLQDLPRSIGTIPNATGGGFTLELLRGAGTLQQIIPLVRLGVEGEAEHIDWLGVAEGRDSIRWRKEYAGGAALPLLSSPEVLARNRLHVYLPRAVTPAATRESVLARDFLLNKAFLVWNDQLVIYHPNAGQSRPSVLPLRVLKGGAGLTQEQLPFVFHSLREENETESLARLQTAWRRQGAAAQQQGFCGGLEIEIDLPLAQPGRGLPLVVSGVTGRADIVQWVWLDAGSAKVGIDHWGLPPDLGEAFAVTPGRHVIRVVSGMLLPEKPTEGRRALPGEQNWRNQISIWVDDRMVFSRRMEFYPSSEETLCVGINLPGGSSCADLLPGVIQAVRPWWPNKVP